MIRTLPLFISFVVGTAASAPRPLLPEPKHLKTGRGHVALQGLSIGFRQSPSAHDRLAAEHLVRRLGANARLQIAIVDGPASIVLDRTDPPTPENWDETPGPDSQEAYSLHVTSKGVRLRSRTARGLFYGVETLAQLVEGRGREAMLPVVDIEDWPSLRYRGFMMDVAHGPLPTVDELERQIDFIARWKFNQFYFYSETNIELDGYRLLSPLNRYTQPDVRRLVAYARERFIDVVPCVELYGHLHDLLRIERYSALGEMPHGGELNPRDPRSLDLVRDWIRQLTALFPSPFFHIGLDETYELGRAPGREMAAAEAGTLYLRFFQQVSAMVRERGRRTLVWGDIFLAHPEVIPKLDPGTIALPWHYGDEPSYDRWVQPFAEARVPTIVTSGVWNWAEAATDFDHTRRNVDGLLASGRKFGTRGLLHTAWTDSAQVLTRMAWPAIAYAGVASWQQTPPTREAYYRGYAEQTTGTAAEPFARALAAVSETQQGLETSLGGRTMNRFWADPFDPAYLTRLRANRDGIRSARLRAEDAQEALLDALAAGGPKEHTLALLNGARMLDYLALKSLFAVEIAEFHSLLEKKPQRAYASFLFGIETTAATHSRLVDLMDAIRELRSEFQARWIEEYASYRLGTALGRFDAENEFWRRFQARLQAFVASFPEGGPVPPLEALRP